MNIEYVTLSSYQVLRLFIGIMITLIVFGAALMSDIGWLWSFLAAHGALYWFKIIWDAITKVVADEGVKVNG